MLEFGYDTAGRLISVTDGDGNVTTIQRDGTGVPTAIQSPFGQDTTLTLDANGNLASITNPAGETTAFTYTSGGLLTGVKNPADIQFTQFGYDGTGRLVSRVDPAGGSDTLVRTNLVNGYEVLNTTAEGTQTTYRVEFLADGQQRRTNVLPDGTQAETLIGTDGSQATVLPDGMELLTEIGPDPRFGMQAPVSNSVDLITPGGLNGTISRSTTAPLLDPSNPLSLSGQSDTVSFNGRTSSRNYDAQSRTLTKVWPSGRQQITIFNAQGRAIQMQQGGLFPIEFAYDSQGRVISRSQGGRNTTIDYNTGGYPETVTDAENRSINFQYNASGQVTQQILPDQRIIQYTYDSNGNVLSIIPPGRPPHSFAYTPVDLTKEYSPPVVSGGGSNKTIFSYDTERHRTLTTRPDGQQIRLVYNDAEQLENIILPTGTTTFTYDSVTGNRQTASSPSGNITTYTYDTSLVTNMTWSGPVSGSISWTYDNEFRQSTQSVNGTNTVSFTYDADDLLTGVGALTLNRNVQSGLLTGTLLGTITDSFIHDGFGDVATYEAKAETTLLLSEQYTRDNIGRITEKIETIGGITSTFQYSYDMAGRLAEVKHDGVLASTYLYDANNNRLSKISPAETVSGTYDDQDRLSNYGNYIYVYNPNGEIQSKTVGGQTTTYIYNILGDLLSVTLPDDTLLEYISDGEGRRIAKRINGILVQGFIYQDGLNVSAELDESGFVAARFIYGSRENVPDYMVKNGGIYRIISDHLGSPRIVIDTTTGAVDQRMDYDEFGNVTLDTNPGFQPFGYAGGLYDPQTGLVRFGVRDYDAETGRWTAKDPIRFAGRSLNLYSYARNDPINFADRSGYLPTFSSVVTGLKIADTLAGIYDTIDFLKRLLQGDVGLGEGAFTIGILVIMAALNSPAGFLNRYNTIKISKFAKSNPRVIADGDDIDKLPTLIHLFGGDPKKWVKLAGKDPVLGEVHWYQYQGRAEKGMTFGAKLAGDLDPFPPIN